MIKHIAVMVFHGQASFLTNAVKMSAKRNHCGKVINCSIIHKAILYMSLHALVSDYALVSSMLSLSLLFFLY